MARMFRAQPYSWDFLGVKSLNYIAASVSARRLGSFTDIIKLHDEKEWVYRITHRQSTILHYNVCLWIEQSDQSECQRMHVISMLYCAIFGRRSVFLKMYLAQPYGIQP